MQRYRLSTYARPTGRIVSEELWPLALQSSSSPVTPCSPDLCVFRTADQRFCSITSPTENLPDGQVIALCAVLPLSSFELCSFHNLSLVGGWGRLGRTNPGLLQAVHWLFLQAMSCHPQHINGCTCPGHVTAECQQLGSYCGCVLKDPHPAAARV